MTIDQIKTFITAAKYLNFTKSSELLFITQSAISRQVNAMEAELGTRLFIRQNSQIRLTTAGKILYQGLTSIYQDYTDLLKTIQDAEAGLIGKLRIGIEDNQMIESWLTDLIQQYTQDRPNTLISFDRMNRSSIESALERGEIDIAIMVLLGQELPEGFSQYIYAWDQMYLAVPTALLNEIPPDTPETFQMLLSSLPMVMFSPESLGNFLTPFAWNVLNNKIVRTEFRFESRFQTLQDLVTSGLYCTVANESNYLKNFPDIQFYTAERLGKIRKGIRWMTDSSNPLLPAFIQLIQEKSPCPQTNF